MAMQWHKRILSYFSLGLEDRTASSYQGHLLGSGLVISSLKDSDEREERKRKKILTGIFLLPWVDFFRGESFFKLILPSTVAT